MSEKMSFSEKHPIISSILVAFMLLLVLFVSGMISAVTGTDSKITFFSGFLIAGVTIILFISLKKDWNYYGFNSINNIEKKDKLLFIPLFIMALLPLFVGLSSDLTMRDIIYVIFFMAIVAFVEEALFRGIILRILLRKGTRYAILGSCLLFSIPHIMNTLNGRNLAETIIQILFAFVIGLILAMLVIKTNNIVLPITYHFINNVVSSLTDLNVNNWLSQSLSFIIFLIGIIYMSYLYYVMKKNSTSIEKEC